MFKVDNKDTRTYFTPCPSVSIVNFKHVIDIGVNEIAVADTDEAYSNTQGGTSCKNSNIIDLLTIFTKSPIPDTCSGPDFISGR